MLETKESRKGGARVDFSSLFDCVGGGAPPYEWWAMVEGPVAEEPIRPPVILMDCAPWLMVRGSLAVANNNRSIISHFPWLAFVLSWAHDRLEPFTGNRFWGRTAPQNTELHRTATIYQLREPIRGGTGSNHFTEWSFWFCLVKYKTYVSCQQCKSINVLHL